MKPLVLLIAALLVANPHIFGMAGTLDITFNANGIQPGTTAILIANQTISTAQAIAVQLDGKIVVAGYSSNNPGTSNFAVARFNTNGLLDTTFGTNGTAFTTIDNQVSGNFAYGVVIQPDGKIVLGGTTRINNINQFAIARFESNGTLDTTFNAAGTQPGTAFTTSVGGYNTDNIAYAIALQQDGKIVLAGYADNGAGDYEFAVARFNSDGTIDTTFNGTGSATTTINNQVADNQAYAMLIQQDGKIILAGHSKQAGNIYEFAVARFNTNGTLDTTFNQTGGQPGTAFTPSINGFNIENFAISAVLQSDGKIVVAGYTNIGGNSYEFGIARFNSDGTLDTTFNPTGIQPGTTSTKVDNEMASPTEFGGSALQPNGKIIMGGTISNTSGGTNFALARFTSNGLLDTTFNNNGIQPGTVSTAINGNGPTGNNFGYAVTLQQNGAILIAGNSILQEINDYFGVARFNGDSITNPCALILIEKYGQVQV